MDVLAGFAIFLTGFVLGALVVRLWPTDKSQRNTLSKQLDEIHAEYAQYQQHVDDHFKTTAELVNKLTHAYSDIHSHLSHGAQNLSKRTLAHTAIDRIYLNAPAPLGLDQTADTSGLSDTKIEVSAYPPKDYAPKAQASSPVSNLEQTSPTQDETTREK